MATVIIPTPLRKFHNNTAKVYVQASTIREAVENVGIEFPDIKKYLVDEQGYIRAFVNVFLGSDDIRDLEEENTPVRDDSVVSIVPAIAGGME